MYSFFPVTIYHGSEPPLHPCPSTFQHLSGVNTRQISRRGASVDGMKVVNFVFADDVVIFAESLKVLMMAIETKQLCLFMHVARTMRSWRVSQSQIVLRSRSADWPDLSYYKVAQYKYLGLSIFVQDKVLNLQVFCTHCLALKT